MHQAFQCIAQGAQELANQLDATASEIRASEAKNTALLKQHTTFYDDKLLGHQDDLANHVSAVAGSGIHQIDGPTAT